MVYICVTLIFKVNIMTPEEAFDNKFPNLKELMQNIDDAFEKVKLSHKKNNEK
jgi:hypothetical protein